jgi:hypothetical protein
MDNINIFKSNQNLNMLWEVLLDELNINANNTKMKNNIKTVFDTNINLFLINANKTAPIMLLNKQFLGQVVLAVNQLIPTIKQENNIKKITITNEEIIEPYKIEDIHASRQTDFEKEVERKKAELESYLIPPKPINLDFSDNNQMNLKITEIGPLLAEKMAERNLELEKIQNMNYNPSTVNPDSWLKSQETSVKKDFKPEQKKVTFEMDDSTTNIFSKLKKNTLVTVEPEIEEIQVSEKYVEQKSILLPEPKSERLIVPINNNPTTPNIPIIQNIPFIPNNELIKQLNEMNSKIDILSENINLLTNIVKSLQLGKEEEVDNLSD